MIARKMLDFAYGSSIATVGFAALGFNLALFRPVRSRHVALICFSAVSVLSVLVLVLVRETLLAASVSTQTFRWLSRPSDFGGRECRNLGLGGSTTVTKLLRSASQAASDLQERLPADRESRGSWCLEQKPQRSDEAAAAHDHQG